MTGTGLVEPESLAICLGRSRGHDRLMASTSHHQPCVSSPLLCFPLPYPLPPTLSCLFIHLLPLPLCPCPCLRLPYCPLMVSFPLTLSHPSLLCLAFLFLTVLSSSYLCPQLPALCLPISVLFPFLVLSATLPHSGLSLSFLPTPLHLASLL